MSPRTPHSALLLLLLTLVIVLLHPVSAHTLQRRAVLRVDSTAASTSPPVSVPVNLSARYAVRWMDPSSGVFGATLNLTFAPAPELFAKHWQIRLRLADNGTTAIREFWGSWSCTELLRGWYQLQPAEDLRLNNQSQVYFSFNGVWNSSRGDWNTTKMAATALEIQVAEPGNTREAPRVYQLRDAGEFSNEPVPFEIPATAFGNFARNPSRPGNTVARMLGSLPAVLPPQPTDNFTGLYIVFPFLGVACLALVAATLQSWRWRRMYRLQLEQVALIGTQSGNKAGYQSSAAIQDSNAPDAAEPSASHIMDKAAVAATYDNAYAGYYMMMDGAWDMQVVHEGEGVDASRPYSYAPVVTDANAAARSASRSDGAGTPQQRSRRSTNLLIPGREYRMTLLERGVPMPAEWLPPALQQKIASPLLPPPQMPPPPPPAAAYDLPPIQFALPPPPPFTPPATAIQSRGIASGRMHKEIVPPPALYIAETVPAVDGAVVVPAANQSTHHLMLNLPETSLVSPLSPGWPLVVDDGDEASAYSPPRTSELNSEQDRRPSDGSQVLAVSLGSNQGSASTGSSKKPTPAVRGWNMI